MPWAGGSYTKGNSGTGGWVGDASLGIGIEAGRHDTQDNDFATGINQCINKDGSNAFTGDANLGGFKPTNIAAGTAAAPALCVGGDVNTGVFGPAADTWAVATNGTEKLRVDSSGKVGIGNSSPTAALDLQTGETDGFFSSAYRTDANGAYWYIRKSRNGSLGGNTIVQNGDAIGAIFFQGANGTGYTNAAAIVAEVNGAPSASNDMPGSLRFNTTPDGSGTLTTRMTINNAGSVTFGASNELPASSNVVGASFYRAEGLLQLSRSGGDALGVNRISNDGNLVVFLQDGIIEGSISVSGSTVAYNGAHLTRWSQLPSGVERSDILRGTVLSNIDEMCEWGEELNEQLNRMKVSDVEGDPNVSGVFQSWDDDDETYINDFYCAMTGDFIIRIGAGVTVNRGDLLMSAGDGTAKPQADDIIRSKTIAKVTSTNVVCTYDDGSYCVPCVLMAC